MNEYSFEIEKKYGGEEPSYRGLLTCNGAAYSMMLTTEEGEKYRAVINDLTPMQNGCLQNDYLDFHISEDGKASYSTGEYRYENQRFQKDAAEIMEVAKTAVDEYERNLAIDAVLDVGKPGPAHTQNEPER